MAALASLASVTVTSFLVIVLARAVWHKVERFLETELRDVAPAPPDQGTSEVD